MANSVNFQHDYRVYLFVCCLRRFITVSGIDRIVDHKTSVVHVACNVTHFLKKIAVAMVQFCFFSFVLRSMAATRHTLTRTSVKNDRNGQVIHSWLKVERNSMKKNRPLSYSKISLSTMCIYAFLSKSHIDIWRISYCRRLWKLVVQHYIRTWNDWTLVVKRQSVHETV